MSEIVQCGCGRVSRLSNLLVGGACPECGYSDDLVEVRFKSMRAAKNKTNFPEQTHQDRKDER